MQVDEQQQQPSKVEQQSNPEQQEINKDEEVKEGREVREENAEAAAINSISENQDMHN